MFIHKTHRSLSGFACLRFAQVIWQLLMLYSFLVPVLFYFHWPHDIDLVIVRHHWVLNRRKIGSSRMSFVKGPVQLLLHANWHLVAKHMSGWRRRLGVEPLADVRFAWFLLLSPCLEHERLHLSESWPSICVGDVVSLVQTYTISGRLMLLRRNHLAVPVAAKVLSLKSVSNCALLSRDKLHYKIVLVNIK